MRCRDCEARFNGHYLMPDTWFYAKCPRCYRSDLNTWDARHYKAGWWTRWKLSLGAKQVRCEACRCNFASFRPRRTWYRRPKPSAALAARLGKVRESIDYELPEFDSDDRFFPQKENGSK